MVIQKTPKMGENLLQLFAVWISLICRLHEVGSDSTGYHTSKNNYMPQHEQPNIIFILADDLGFNDVSYNGKFHGSAIKTPTIDKLAAEGVKLNNYYVQPSCAPSRSQLMTGRYQIRMGLQSAAFMPFETYCLPPDEVTWAQKMKEAGYATHKVGKWHLGLYQKECLPTNRGFDTFLGYYLGGEYYYTHNFITFDDGIVVNGYDFHEEINGSSRDAFEYKGLYSTFVFTQKAQEIIKRHKSSKPMFLSLSFQAPHLPLEVPEEYSKPYEKLIEDGDRRTIAGMISCLDEAIDNITMTLKETGLYENTIIFFSSDNGGSVPDAGNNWPLRGSKVTLWEGGIRAVGFIHSPLLPKEIQGTTSQAFIHITDWFPTIVSSLAGGNLDGTKPLDGYDVWDAILNGGPTPRTEHLINIDPIYERSNGSDPFFSFDANIRAGLRMGDWKIITGIPGKFNGWAPPPEADITEFTTVETEGKHIWLFNITDDPYEWNDVSDDHPTVVKKMLDRLQEYYEEMEPSVDPGYDPQCNPEMHDGVWGPCV